MFKNGKMYSGETANKMVSNMVAGYKSTIGKLTKENRNLVGINNNLIAENSELQTINDQLSTDNDAMLKVIADLRKELKKKPATNQQYWELSKIYDELLKKFKILQSNADMLKMENAKLLEMVIHLSNSRSSSSENPFITKENISSYPISEQYEVRFDYCVLPDGSEYIDARKYQCGKPTRKGICLSMEDFDTFLRYGRTAWSRVVSGLFKYKHNRR
jgi:regulator of replication initiation timing